MLNKINKEETYCKCYKAHAEIINSQNGMVRTFVTPVRAAAKETEYSSACIGISSRFFENQHNEICSHLSEKTPKGRFLKPEELQNHSNQEKGKEKKKERGERKEEKRKKQWLHS